MTRSILTLALISISSTPVYADNWPQWRGPKNDGSSAEKNLAAEWGPEKNVLWKLPMPGPGSSTPCIWGDKLFITSMDGEDVVLLCIGTDGREKWRKTLGKGRVRTMRDEGGNLASASCSTDGERVYAFSGTGRLVAYDFAGKEIWSLDALGHVQKGADSFRIQFGAHWTPVLHDGKLYVTLLERRFQKVLCINARTGEVAWSIDRKSDSPPNVESPDVYASPFVWQNGDKVQLIVHGNDYCTGHNLADGKELWRVTELNPKAKYNRAWRAVASPLVLPDMIVIPSCKRGVTVAIDPTKAAGNIEPGNVAEKWRVEKNTPDVPSPIRVDDLVYIMGEGGLLYCHDAATGKQLYVERVTNMRHRANPVYADGKLYLQGRDGTLGVVKPGRTFERIADNKLPDTFTASPAIANGVIYLRGWKDLYAIKVK